jgi:hypothetical protein
MKPTAKPSPFALALLLSLLVCNLPAGGWLLYPCKLLATWCHELSHAVVMMVSGVGVNRMLIYEDTSGLAYPETAATNLLVHALISAAGYMATPVLGAVLMRATPTAQQARRSLTILVVCILASSWLLIANQFGLVAMTTLGAALALAALLLPATWRLLLVHLIAAQACVNALLDIRVLFNASQVIDGKNTGASDASTMAQLTFGHSQPWAVWLWAFAWLLWSLAVLYVAIARSGAKPVQNQTGAVKRGSQTAVNAKVPSPSWRSMRKRPRSPLP